MALSARCCAHARARHERRHQHGDLVFLQVLKRFPDLELLVSLALHALDELGLTEACKVGRAVGCHPPEALSVAATPVGALACELDVHAAVTHGNAPARTRTCGLRLQRRCWRMQYAWHLAPLGEGMPHAARTARGRQQRSRRRELGANIRELSAQPGVVICVGALAPALLLQQLSQLSQLSLCVSVVVIASPFSSDKGRGASAPPSVPSYSPPPSSPRTIPSL